MSVEEQIQYHQGRAMRELDLGVGAQSSAAARAHLQLSSLHLARMRDLMGAQREGRPSSMTR